MIWNLCATFLDLGDAVSRNLALAHQDDCHISYGEETITESCLLEIHRRHPAIVKIKTFTKREEANNGADWEWHLVGRAYTFKMRVQAKRLAKGASRFSKLLTYRAAGAPHPQIKMLINDANAHSLYPAICLYSPNGAKKKWRTRAALPYPPGIEFGCLIGDASLVLDNDHSSLERICVPWHYLACSRPVASRWISKSPSIPSIAALNGDEEMEGRGISLTPADWALGSGLSELRESYESRRIMGAIQIDGRGLS
ncbi:DUF6615 family protein [Rhizobium sp. YTU87027]|uniref:DUF6615 family protein n=1 Tax=Rhizobium sp. YTU87027 TaxID=3417741 RepID=UPI003D691210